MRLVAGGRCFMFFNFIVGKTFVHFCTVSFFLYCFETNKSILNTWFTAGPFAPVSLYFHFHSGQ